MSARTDESWEESAESHTAEIETALAMRPDIAVFDSWTPNPSHPLPETTPGTLTNLALRYLRPASALTVTQQGNTITGRLTDADGRGVAGAHVAVTAVDVGASMEPTMRTWSGTVPADAVGAIVGVRVDSESACVCDGAAGAVVGGVHYDETGTGRRQTISLVKLPIEGAPASFRTLALAPGRTFNPNFQQFPVTAGAAYTFQAPIAATASAERAGYLTLIFIDAAGGGAEFAAGQSGRVVPGGRGHSGLLCRIVDAAGDDDDAGRGLQRGQQFVDELKVPQVIDPERRLEAIGRRRFRI